MRTTLVLVMAGSALGGGARFLVSGLIANWIGESFPWNTLVINVSGSFAIGVLGALTASDGRIFASGGLRQFFMAGLCGGYTTFSSFSWQTLMLAQDSEWIRAVGNILLSVTSCLLAVWLGHVVGAAINK